jgi:hypothetical protein
MTKNKSYESWVSTDPIERTAYSGFMAGWNAKSWVGITDEEAMNLAILYPDNRTLECIKAVEELLKDKNA